MLMATCLRAVQGRINGFFFELLWSVVPILVTLLSFLLYIKVQGEELTVAVAFTA